MADFGRSPTLRNLFDRSPTPRIAHPPRTHHRDFYVATDGSFHQSQHRAGLGVVIETRDGTRVARCALAMDAPDNNVAEYLALHLGLDVLAARAPPSARIGVLVDHDELAAHVNQAVLATNHPDWESMREFHVPAASENHWGGIRARIAGFEELRAASIDGDENPAHALANAPEAYEHVNREPARCVLPEPVRTSGPDVPPPSRAHRSAGD